MHMSMASTILTPHTVYENSIQTYTDPCWGIVEYFLEQKKKGRIHHLGLGSLPLSTLRKLIMVTSSIRIPLPLTQMGFLAVTWAYVCIMTDMNLRKTDVSSAVQKLTANAGCFCETPCSPAKYGRTVHTQLKDNPRIFNIPSRDSEVWKREYARRTSVERSNKREKQDYKLEDGRHRSSKMWYCRLYGIMMLQHLDAWEMPSIEAFQHTVL